MIRFLVLVYVLNGDSMQYDVHTPYSDWWTFYTSMFNITNCYDTISIIIIM